VNRSPLLDNVETPPSLVEVAFQAIKAGIMSHRLEPGAIYSEQALARELGISKTPVHEALVDLAAKGFVEILPRRGLRVMVLTEKRIRDLFEFRRPLELAVIWRVTEELTDQAVEHLKGVLDRVAGTHNPVDFQKYDRRFHRYLASLTENHYLISALDNIWDLCDWVGARILAYDGGFGLAVQEHVDIYEHLRRRDAQGAAEALVRHLKSTEARFLTELTASAAGPEAGAGED